ncbi:hypothetical protein LJR220_007149 [Bradyrhizobium sp. LjRoot220]|uniref:hypothetical protein n=1 Tax=Bradyrhizobium sp. LjRoot220 TaxID=3342284 RepID=UPI003ECDD152
MRGVVSILLMVALLFNSGCAIIEKETTNRGGYLDAVLDDHWMKADSKGMRALRAFAMQVSLARIASVSAKNDSDRQLLAIRIGALTKRFLPIYACAFDRNPLGVPGAENDPCFYYDSAMLDYSTGLFDLAMIALPVEDAKKLLNSATGAVINPINILELLSNLVQIGRDALKYGRVVGALYRDTVELEVQLWLATPAIDNRPPPFLVTEAHVAALREIYARRNDDMPAWLAVMAALRSQGLEPMPQPRFFVELGGLMRYLCNLITRDAAALETCKAGLPTTLRAPVAVLSPLSSIGIGNAGRAAGSGQPGSGTDTARPTRPGQHAEQPQPPPLMANATTDVEKTITVADGKKLQRMLCVTPSDGFDTATREQLKNFNRAVLSTDSNAIATDANLQKLRDAQRLYPDCTKAGFRNGLEVGLFARFEHTKTPMRQLLNTALAGAKLEVPSAPVAPVVIDTKTRNAIGNLAARFNLTGTDITRELYAKINPEN